MTMRKCAGWAELEALPEGVKGEIVGGEVVLLPRPGYRHIEVASRLGLVLGGPFDMGLGGPGGWVIVHEPGIAFGDEIRAPDLGGWKVERYASPETNGPYTVVPDWVCEVLSPSNAKKDRIEKLPLYASAGVRHFWIVDPLEFTLEVYRLEGEKYLVIHLLEGDARARIEPFDAIEFDLSLFWRGRNKPEEQP